MLRGLVLVLLVLNALFFGWTRGWLDAVVGIKAGGDREPERMALQFHADRVQLLSPQAAAALRPSACLELGPFDSDAALQAAQGALERAGVPAGSWRVQVNEQPGVWAVATIRLGSKDFQARKEETYRKLKISYEFLQGPPEELPTLLLSRHASEKAAEAALDALSQRALKGLRVLPLQPAVKQQRLQFAQADGLMQARLQGLQDAALAGGVKACSVAAAPAAGAAASAGSAATPASAP